jgi:hypothetical protein
MIRPTSASRPHLPEIHRYRRRFNRDIGGCLGGVVLGAGGCLLGASLPYQHPVAVAVSMLWWGIYLGCLGLSIGAVRNCWETCCRSCWHAWGSACYNPPSQGSVPGL